MTTLAHPVFDAHAMVEGENVPLKDARNAPKGVCSPPMRLGPRDYGAVNMEEDDDVP